MGPERRRLWSDEERLQIVAEALPMPVFVEAVMDDDPASAASYGEHPAMIIDLPRGKWVSILAAASPAPDSAPPSSTR